MCPPLRARGGFTKVEAIVVIAMLVVVLAIVVPFVQKVHEADARAQSNNNLKQMSLGLHDIVSVGDLEMPPSVGRYPGTNGPNASLFFHIIPFIECDTTYRDYKNNYGAIE